MSEVHSSERNFRILLTVAGIALAVGAITGGVAFGVLIGSEHVLLGLRTGALLSQTLVWGSVIFIGVGSWVYDAVRETRGQAQPSEADLKLEVNPSEIERPIAGPATAVVAKSTERKLEEVSV